jgi:hypothetical protein
VSEFVPGTIVLRLADVGQLEELCRRTGLGRSWLDFENLKSDSAQRHDPFSPPPSYYQESQRWFRWSLGGGGADRQDVEFVHFSRKDKPVFWQVTAAGLCLWSYNLNAARLWATALAQLPLTKGDAGPDVEVERAFLPLPMARAVNWIGAGIAGPTAQGAYRYPVGNHALRSAIVQSLEKRFDVRRFRETLAGEGDLCSIR